MKYIKLFENFNQSDLEDIKWILIDLDNNPKLINNELDGKVLLYSIPGDYSDDSNLWVSKFETAKKRLYDMEYELVTDINDAYLLDRILIISSEYYDKYSLNEIALLYMDQFKNMELDKSKSWPVYLDKNGKMYLHIQEGIKTAVVDKDIWNLLDMFFPIDGEDLVKAFGVNKNVGDFLLKWVNENYSEYNIKKVAMN